MCFMNAVLFYSHFRKGPVFISGLHVAEEADFGGEGVVAYKWLIQTVYFDEA